MIKKKTSNLSQLPQDLRRNIATVIYGNELIPHFITVRCEDVAALLNSQKRHVQVQRPSFFVPNVDNAMIQ